EAASVGVLVGRHVEQAEEAPAKIIRRLGIFVRRRLRLEPLVAVEGVQLALEPLLFGELAPGLEHAVLCAQMRRVGAGRLRRVRATRAAALACSLGDLQAGPEAFEVALLLGVEIAGHRLALVRFFSEQRACQRTAQTAAVGPVCCEAAKTVPERFVLFLLRNPGSLQARPATLLGRLAVAS